MSKYLFCILVCLLSATALRAQTERVADEWVGQGDPPFLPGTKLLVGYCGEGSEELDSVLFRVFDAGHRLLGEYRSEDCASILGRHVAVICDPGVINYYGMCIWICARSSMRSCPKGGNRHLYWDLLL